MLCAPTMLYIPYRDIRKDPQWMKALELWVANYKAQLGFYPSRETVDLVIYGFRMVAHLESSRN